MNKISLSKVRKQNLLQFPFHALQKPDTAIWRKRVMENSFIKKQQQRKKNIKIPLLLKNAQNSTFAIQLALFPEKARKWEGKR